jgi:Family of unknown function (DUF6247)
MTNYWSMYWRCFGSSERIKEHVGMRAVDTTEAAEPLRPRSFKDASPREIRAALVPEEQLQFDISWRAAMATAVEVQDLSEVFNVLDSWRAHAMITIKLGHHGYRQWLAHMERIERTGEPIPGAVPWSQLKAELGL